MRINDYSPWWIVLALVVFVTWNSLFIVNQTQQAIVVQLGEPVRVIRTPGLKAKIPFIQTVVRLDKRILDLNTPAKEVIASDQKRLIINAFTKYRIVDPLKFYKSVHQRSGADGKLNTIFDSSLRQVIGKVPMNSLLNNKRLAVLEDLREAMAKQAEIFGIEIVDSRIMRSDLPAENSEAIFRRMQTDREKEAKEIRAEGEEQASIIRANADKEREIILAEANKKANILRGEGDATASKIFATAFGRDRVFYNFYRSLQAYEQAFTKGIQPTQWIITPNDNEFIKYMLKKPNINAK